MQYSCNHAIGFHHEQKLPDRDESVSIQTRIESGQETKLNKLTTKELDSLGEPYWFDYIILAKEDRQLRHIRDLRIEKHGKNPTKVESNDIRQTNSYTIVQCGRTFERQSFSLVTNIFILPRSWFQSILLLMWIPLTSRKKTKIKII